MKGEKGKGKRSGIEIVHTETRVSLGNGKGRQHSIIHSQVKAATIYRHKQKLRFGKLWLPFG